MGTDKGASLDGEVSAIRTGGVMIECEGGYFAGDAAGGAVFDRQGRKIKDLARAACPRRSDAAHLANFLAGGPQSEGRRPGVPRRSRGIVSTACCHMANMSYRLGKQSSPDAIRETIRGNAEMADAFERCRDYLRANNIDLAATQAVLGPWVTLDEQERFVGEFAQEANELCHRDYREPFAVPKVSA